MFLLNQGKRTISVGIPGTFTFQYVSIKSNVLSILHIISTIFTFQYVSIKSYWLFEVCMLLQFFTFQYVSIKSQKSNHLTATAFRLYIPICFYLIRYLLPSAYLQTALHSNMFLLNRCHRRWTRLNLLQLYIPICFY